MAEDDLRAAARAVAEQWWEPEKTSYCSTPLNYAIHEAACNMGLDTDDLYDLVWEEIHKIRKEKDCET